jgi:hypothetical protein
VRPPGPDRCDDLETVNYNRPTKAKTVPPLMRYTSRGRFSTIIPAVLRIPASMSHISRTTMPARPFPITLNKTLSTSCVQRTRSSGLGQGVIACSTGVNRPSAFGVDTRCKALRVEKWLFPVIYPDRNKPALSTFLNFYWLGYRAKPLPRGHEESTPLRLAGLSRVIPPKPLADGNKNLGGGGWGGCARSA